MALTQLNSTQSRNRAQRRAQKTRRRLMDAALALFTERSIDGTTIAQITERADVGKGTFYRHFATKAHVLEALTQEAADRLVESLHACSAGTAGIEEALDRLVQAHAVFYTSNHPQFVLLFQGRLMSSLRGPSADGQQGPLSGYLRELELAVRPFLPAPAEAPKIRQLALALAGYVGGFYSLAVIGKNPAEIERMCEPVRRGFVARSAVFLGAIKSCEPGSPPA